MPGGLLVLAHDTSRFDEFLNSTNGTCVGPLHDLQGVCLVQRGARSCIIDLCHELQWAARTTDHGIDQQRNSHMFDGSRAVAPVTGLSISRNIPLVLLVSSGWSASDHKHSCTVFEIVRAQFRYEGDRTGAVEVEQ